MTDEEIVLLALDKAKDASIRKGASKEIGMHSLYKDSVDAMMSIKYHATKGLFPTPLFKNSSPNVEDKELKYIENNFKQTTLTVFVDYLSTITRPFGDGNWAIDYKEEEDLYTKDNKTFKKYVEEELPIYKSLENFIKFILPSTKSIDANGFLSIRPFEIDYKRLEDGTEVVDDGELYRPTIFYFDSASVVDYEHKEYYLFLSQKKSKVKVAGKLEKTGLVFELYTRSGIYLIRQTGDKSKNTFEWELYYQNKTSEIPVVQLMGVPSRVEEESIFWSSPFSYATDLLDLALINANWLQASIKKCVYPHVVMFGSKCEFKDNDGSICQDGIINYGMPTQRTCSQCNGSGLKSRLSPLGTLLLQPTTTVTTGEEKTSQPPLQFVSPQVEVLKYIEENIYSHESKARTILKLRNKNSTVKTTGDVTATEIYDDSKSMTAFVKPISDQIFTIYEWALYFIGLQRYETSFKMPELSYPKTFDFKTPEEIAELNSSFSKKTIKFSLDNLTDIRTSQPATVTAGLATDLGTGSNDGIDFANYENLNKSDLLWNQGSSAVTFGLKSTGLTSADEVSVTFGPEGAPVEVIVPSVDGVPPTTQDVAKALNLNASFASSYVAQAASKVTLAGVDFNGAPAATAFSTFTMTVAGKTLNLADLAPSSATLAGLASLLQTRLRSEDDGKTDLSVTVSGTDLVVKDAQGRKLTGISLGKPAASVAVLPTSTVETAGELKITAIDPNVSAADISSSFALTQGSDTSSGVGAVITTTENSTVYPRFTASYALAGTAPYKAVLGTGSNEVVITSESTDTAANFVTKLNANDEFSLSYSAELDLAGTGIVVTAKDPSTTGASKITDNLVLSNSANTALVTTAGVGGVSAPSAFVGKKSIDDLKNQCDSNDPTAAILV